MTDHLMEKDQLLAVLNEVGRQLPVNRNIDIKIVKRIRASLEDHISASSVRRPEGYSEYDISVDIEFKFEEISKEDFDQYSVKIKDITVKKFLLDEGFGRDADGAFKNTNSASNSIRLIAAFLILSDTNSLTFDDLTNPNLSNVFAKNLTSFIDFADEDGDVRLDHIQGIYVAKIESKISEVDSIQLILEKSSDGSHLLAEEKFTSGLSTNDNWNSTSKAYGWCIKTQSDILLLVLKNPKTEASVLYTSLHFQLDKASLPSMEKVLFQRHDRHFDSCSDSHEAVSHSEFADFLKKHQLVFSKKTADILTFEKPFDARTRKRSLSKMIGMDDDTRSSAANVIDIERKENIMDEEETEKLSKEMLECIIDIANKDEERFFELLDMGASINYRHPKLNCTVMHAVGQFYPEFFEEVLKRSHEEYDFLIRDKNGHLASGWAFDTYPHNPLYELMRKKEIEYGKEQNVYPDSLRDRPWDEVFPDGYFPNSPSME